MTCGNDFETFLLLKNIFFVKTDQIRILQGKPQDTIFE